MKILVLGAGVIGVTTAHYLAEDGHEVTVVDRQSAPAMETSWGNAGDVCPSYATPWAAPGMRIKALKWLLSNDAPLKMNWRLDPALARWMLAWSGNCSPARFNRNKPRMQRLSRYSLLCLQALRRATGIRYDETTSGLLQLLRTQKELEAVVNHTRILEEMGIPHQLVEPRNCANVDTGLANSRVQFSGGLYLPMDETGDCHLFTQTLAERTRTHGVSYRFGTTIEAVHVEGGTVTGVKTSAGMLSADRYIVALACGSVKLLRPLDIRLPIQPVKGYSVTLPITDRERAPRAGIMDEHTKVAITRFGNRLRAAGTAELGSWSTDLREDRCRMLLEVVNDLYPGSTDVSRAQFWAGLRPMTPDGPPLLGPTHIANLMLNVGHGSQGWSMSCGSAKVIADLVAGRAPDIDLEGLTMARYASA